MNPKNPSAFHLVRSSAPMTALLFLTLAPSSFACLQGYHLPPPKPALPVDSQALKPSRVKFAPPPIEPIKLDGLFDAAALIGQPAKAAEAVESHEEMFARYAREFEARPAGKASFEDTMDYAVALVHLGRVRAAVDLLLALERQRPGVYTTAANLGTAYELAGDLPEALAWIGKGIERNPKSHEGTEWLHLAILRAKISLHADADWLKQHTVLEGAEGRNAGEITRAIEYQLHERLHFVQPADAVVCDLFYQAALLATGEEGRVKRVQWLRESLRFGEWRKAEAEALLKT